MYIDQYKIIKAYKINLRVLKVYINTHTQTHTPDECCVFAVIIAANDTGSNDVLVAQIDR